MRKCLILVCMLLPFVMNGQELPQYVDNSVNKYFPPIIDQHGGSCAQASSIGYVFTYEMNRYLDRDASASPANRFSYQFIWNLVNDGIDQGGFAEDGLFVAMRSGAMAEEDFFTLTTNHFTWPSGFEKYRNALRYRVDRIVTIKRDVEAYKEYLAGSDGKPGGILSFSGHCYGWNMKYDYDGPSGTGYTAIATTLPDDGSHAMTIVGYDDLVCYTDAAGVKHEGAFIVANTWGDSMHDRGRFYYPYDFFRNETVIGRVISEDAVTAEVRFQEPRILYRLTIEYTSRNDLAYSIGATDKVPSGTPDNYYLQTGMSNKGGDHYMRGTYDKEPLEFALDLTDNIPQSDPDYCRYFLKIIRSARGKRGAGELRELSMIDYRGEKPVEYKYKGPLPATLVDGENVFSIGLVPRFSVPCAQTRAVQDKPIYMKTASGKNAKVVLTKDGSRTKVEYSVVK